LLKRRGASGLFAVVPLSIKPQQITHGTYECTDWVEHIKG